jgi:glycosyltransferase involved in cell wall biosynthesis
LDLHFPHRFVRWDKNKEIEQINEFDIGIMPLQMNEWSKGKCGMKLLQYMSLGIPSVSTPVGVNSTIVSHGFNGMLAASPREWEDSLAQLIEDEALRKGLASAARKTVEEKFSARLWFPRLLEIYRSYLS